MRNILVLGDPRWHCASRNEPAARDPLERSFPDERTTWELEQLGGPWMMAAAILDSLLTDTEIRSLTAGRGPTVASYAEPSQPEAIADRVNWTIDVAKGSSFGCYRLWNPQASAPRNPIGRGNELEFPPRIVRWLTGRATLPEIICINDLGGQFREITVTGPSKVLGYSPQALKEIRRTLSDLLAFADSSTIPRRYLLQPIIVCAIDTPKIPRLLPASRGSVAPNIWRVLHENKSLHDRVVVLFDAERLREARYGISTALSWERTAQETLSTFQSEPTLAPYLDFGSIIVRFGVSGALHISREGDHRRCTLFFNPRLDDSSWVDPAEDGYVLGASSVLTACIVRELCRACYSEDNKALIQGARACVSTAIPLALRGCHSLYAQGYGPRHDHPSEVDFSELLAPPSDFSELIGRPPISRVEVPVFHSPTWSILAQASQHGIAGVVEDVVRYGPDVVLNAPVYSAQDISIPASRVFAERFLGPFMTKGGPALLRGGDVVRDTLESLVDLLKEHQQSLTKEEARRLLQQIDKSARQDLIELVSGRGARRVRAPRVLTIDEFVNAFEKTAHLMQGVFKSFWESKDAKRIEIPAPLGWFGSLLLVDRREIEGYHTIKNLIRRHLEQIRQGQSGGKRPRRPLSIAVFGPPGSGKSTAVRTILETIADAGPVEQLSFNISQLSGLNDFADAFKRITDSIARDQVPVAFFDEFDADFESAPLGWLKYFLSPMEDGTFRSGDKTLMNAILVFAGGTSATFGHFSRKNRSPTDEEWIKFTQAKGPDFVSRLSGHLDILGINPVDADDELFLIRRAIVLRALLEQTQNIKSGKEADIDGDLLNALLYVPAYRHGVRSLRILLEMCKGRSNEITRSVIPPVEQLNMHLDGKSFLDLLRRGAIRSRPQS